MKRAALVGILVVMAIVHAIIAFWTPVQGDAWRHWEWAGQHPGAGLVAWLGDHRTLSDAVGYLLARSNAVHVILTPAVEVALVIGVFVLAMRRLPQSEWRDVTGIALVSASIWIAQPSAGVTWFHLPSVAMNVYGAALAVWFIAPWRCGWTVPRVLWPVLVIVGYLVGTSTREIAIATLGFTLVTAPRRVLWVWLALGGLVVGAIVGYTRSPGFELGAWSSLPVADAGRLVTWIAAFALAGSLAGELATEDRPDPAEMLRGLVAWFVIAIACMFDPHADAATYLPATIALVIGAVPALWWLAGARRYRYALAAVAVIVHALAWTLALRAYHELGREGQLRSAILEHTKPGEIAIVPPYSQIAPTAWVVGDDLGSAVVRQRLAIEAFGLRDIVVGPAFRDLEPNPGISLELAVDGVPKAALEAAHPPTLWAGELSVAREQFAQFVARLRAVAGGDGVSARLTVRLHFDQLRGRPLVAAWFEHGELVAPHVTRASADATYRIASAIDPVDAGRFIEAWSLRGATATPIPYERGRLTIQPLTAELVVIVACDAARCLAADAFTPHF